MGTAWGWAQEATVSIEVWNPAEERLRAPYVTLVELGTQKEAGKFQNGRALGIPYGEYILEVGQPGFKTHEQRISIYQPEVFMRVLLRVANTSDASLTGVLKPKASPDDWVKLVSIRGNNTPVVETKVRSDGSFELTGFDGGDYLLLVVRGLKVIHSEQLSTFYGMKNIEITIPADKPKP